MNASVLEQSWLKFRRGKEHLDALDREFRTFCSADSYTVIHEYDAERTQNVLRFKMLKTAPQHTWGLILGDAVHNARSALDYIAWRLAGSDLSDVKTMFPIYRSIIQFDHATWRLGRIHPDALAYIRTLQPYTRPDPNRSVLWMLQELDARDKHKLIAMTQSVTIGARFRVDDPIPVTIPYAAVEGRIEHDTILAEYPGPAKPQVNVEFDFLFGVLFEQGVLSASGNYQVGPCLEQIFEAVEVIITNFERLLAANPHWIPT
jgi:hypothetical protein